jgi:hypothetical protein
LIGARVVLLLAIGGLSCSPPSRQRAIVPSVAVPLPQRVELERGGWRLVADLQRPVSRLRKPFRPFSCSTRRPAPERRTPD